MGDAARIIMSNAVISEILEKNLVEQCVRLFSPPIILISKLTTPSKQARVDTVVSATSRSLLHATQSICRTSATRAKGAISIPDSDLSFEIVADLSDRTYTAFDTINAGPLLKAMKLLGVNIGFCGLNTIRLRPMLIFDENLSMLPSAIL